MGIRLRWFFRLAFLLFILVVIIGTILLLRLRWQALLDGYVDLTEGGDPDLTLIERLYLQTYLSTQTEQLTSPVGDGATPVSFAISPGESADVIASNLVQAGLLSDADLFVRYVRFHGLDETLEAGDYTLSPRLTLPELALTLTEAYAQEIELRFLEGWRLEEMAEYLSVTNPADISADEFQAIAQRETPFNLSNYDFLSSLPPEATLEGFLFPDTYLLPLEADAAYLVDQMLQNFGQRVTPALRQAFGAKGLSLRQAVALASIIEREAVVPEERPLIAGVFFNRLAQNIKLEADPTAQYALGYQPQQESWWKSPLDLDDLQVDSPYNTYLVSGLPPGPIANPGLSSLEAVAEPRDTDFLFFVVDCRSDVAGSHIFSASYEEHLAHVQRCR